MHVSQENRAEYEWSGRKDLDIWLFDFSDENRVGFSRLRSTLAPSQNAPRAHRARGTSQTPVQSQETDASPQFSPERAGNFRPEFQWG